MRSLKAPTNLPEPIRRIAYGLLVGLLKQAVDGRRQTRDDSFDQAKGLPTPVPLPELSSLVCRLPSPQSLTLIAGGLETRGLIQLSLFGDPDRGPLLRAAIARIQDRFGEAAIVPAGRLAERLARLRDGAPDR